MRLSAFASAFGLAEVIGGVAQLLVMPEFDSTSVLKSNAKNLAKLMSGAEDSGRLWRADELKSIFRHQMAAPMLVDLGSFDPGTATRLRTLADAQGLVLKSFSDLFQHPAPLIELLELVKAFAKANMGHPESALPGEIASALYYVSIAAALVRLDARISRLSDADLERGFQWSRSQSWLDEPTRDLLAQASRKLSGNEQGKATGA